MVYLDNAASTAPFPEVVEACARVATEHFANPSSAHKLGAAAARLLEIARAQVATLVGAEPRQILFTSGGTEANALGLLGLAGLSRGRHIVVSAIEHPAVLLTAERLVARGFSVTRVAPGPDGVLSAASVVQATRPETAVVAVMLVNNEVGTVQPVAQIAAALAGRVPLHVDAVQAMGALNVDAQALGATTMALSAHKMHGPKGIGALWLAPGARIDPLWDGGRQERQWRSGTENLPGCVGFGVAAEKIHTQGPLLAGLRDRLEEKLARLTPHARPTVPLAAPRAPHIVSITLPGLPAEPLLHAMEARGVFVSAGSACASRTQEKSHVLDALGVRDDDAVLRFSLSRFSTSTDVDRAVIALGESIIEVSAMTSLGRRQNKGPS